MKSGFDEMMKGLDEVESFLEGERKSVRVHIPERVDVKAIRRENASPPTVQRHGRDRCHRRSAILRRPLGREN